MDRLTRSLADFAKIVEIFDAQGVSFVSVTQQFNTTSSMGRLTLNVLLSFAQFEREVTGERIRDKIAASKQKGMWMGGYVPLGYDVKERKLLVNEAEAELIRDIYRRYLQLGCVRRVKAALDRQGIRSKTRMGRDGKPFGGGSFSRGALYTLLRNRLYIGEVSHRGKAYPGEHPAIVPRELWEQVQDKLQSNRVERRNGTHAKNPSLLAGLLFDEHGQRMTPSHAAKQGKRYRYYFSQGLLRDSDAQPGAASRIPAHELEQRVVERISTFLETPQDLVDTLALPEDDSRTSAGLIAAAKKQRAQLQSATPAALRPVFLRLISKVTLSEHMLQINVLKAAFRRWLLQVHNGREADVLQHDAEGDGESPSIIVLTVDIALRRWSGASHLVLPQGSSPAPQLNGGLIRAVACAKAWHAELLSGRGKSQPLIAKDMGVSERYLRKIIPCAFLAPDIVEAILQGRQPADLTLAKLTKSLPIKWADQRQQLAFVGM